MSVFISFIIRVLFKIHPYLDSDLKGKTCFCSSDVDFKNISHLNTVFFPEILFWSTSNEGWFSGTVTLFIQLKKKAV